MGSIQHGDIGILLKKAGQELKAQDYVGDIEDLWTHRDVLMPPCMRSIVERTRRNDKFGNGDRQTMAKWLLAMRVIDSSDQAFGQEISDDAMNKFVQFLEGNNSQRMRDDRREGFKSALKNLTRRSIMTWGCKVLPRLFLYVCVYVCIC